MRAWVPNPIHTKVTPRPCRRDLGCLSVFPTPSSSLLSVYLFGVITLQPFLPFMIISPRLAPHPLAHDLCFLLFLPPSLTLYLLDHVTAWQASG
ncbi:hypothetical protein DB88DRAFT_499101 [Papiliotrema laurentii]|uniref:Uncharacterized protein n=1 Tax=Papiliotrema laurentii TaxID=5418 RepID=A0AAD9CVZ9_PAPLA|nr:hypothetical protein DB88DRAFT_499101 [Papiliotrema laurentii]